MNSRKIRAVGLGVIVIVIIAALIAMGSVQSTKIADVKKVKVSDVGDNSASVTWSKVSSADGYFIYAKQNDGDYKKIMTVKDKSDTTAKLNKLEQGTKYSAYVTAYKMKKDKVVESQSKDDVAFCTVPTAPNVSATSPDEGILDMKWSKNDKAQGYQIQYVKGDDFSSPKQVEITNNNEFEQKIEKLTAKDTYSVRARCYVSFNKSREYSAWSKTAQVKIAEKIDMTANIDKSKPMIALTFDDGPGYNTASDKILDVLEKYHARATFFMVGQNAADHPKNVKRKVQLGCQIGNHTYKHDHYGKNVTKSDISKASEAIYKACGQYPTAFRSTGGNTTQLMLDECAKEKMPLYYWSLDTEDWKYRDANKVYNAVMKNVGDGDIILMHEIYSSTADAVERMVPELIKKGYQLVTCDELVAAKSGKNPVAGTQYVDGTTVNNKTS